MNGKNNQSSISDLNKEKHSTSGSAILKANDLSLEDFVEEQLKQWTDAQQRFNELQQVETKEVEVGSLHMKVQYNPARMVSTGAKIDKKALAARPCFLCEKNRPAVQMKQVIDDKFELLINPFPILPQHFTIPLRQHQPQQIRKNYTELHRLLSIFPDLMFFYNGPKCGASAPDHVHFQGGSAHVLPLMLDWEVLAQSLKPLTVLNAEESLSLISGYPCPAFVIQSRSEAADEKLFLQLYNALPLHDDDTEPMLNIVSWRREDNFISVIFPRKKHRPACYFAQGDQQMLISPGALDMSGLLITPRLQDFEKISGQQIEEILREMTLSQDEIKQVIAKLTSTTSPQNSTLKCIVNQREPKVSVGIVGAETILFSLNQNFLAKGEVVNGEQEVQLVDGAIKWKGNYYRELTFVPQSQEGTFSLNDVTIGVNFHWERKETQTFYGILRLVVEGGKIFAINDISVERYLESVISSEMKATSSSELLKAHAVISRSWLLAQIEKRQHLEEATTGFFSFIKKEDELIRWYDREDHTLFDVCADDHCQRYQGITTVPNQYVSEAIKQTKGQVLMYENEICDARFSKCCGGISEEYPYCWENISKPYLRAVRDIPNKAKAQPDILPDLTNEENAEKWIRTTPEAFCHTSDQKVLAQVLNDYDQETTDFYRWKVTYSQAKLKSLIEERTKKTFGDILDLIALERGKSGRISRLKIVGSLLTFTIGKELEIRRTLSDSHLYSSAFVVDKKDVINGIPQQFVLTGAGWGHGVGLCQIGAAVMGEEGYTYDEILAHYYRDAVLQKLYE